MGIQASQGFWSREEQNMHINVLELQAVLMGLKSLCSALCNCHLRINIDNTTTVSYLNNMGGTHSRECNEVPVI